jgi:hypothetical protein
MVETIASADPPTLVFLLVVISAIIILWNMVDFPVHASVSVTRFFVRYVNPVRRYLMEDCGGGPRPLQARQVINLCKAGTIVVMGTLLIMTKSTNELGPCVYTALHGSYGMVWYLKDMVMPDPNWNVYTTIPSSLLLLLGLVLYWSPGYFLMLRTTTTPIVTTTTPLRAMLAIILHTIGVVLMMCTDAQKYFVLKEKAENKTNTNTNHIPKGGEGGPSALLISNGWLYRCRNMNYLGEIMLYSSYAILAQHWFPWCVYLLFAWPLVFGANMCVKEIRLARKPNASNYFAQSGFLFPKVWTTTTTTTDGDDGSYVQELAKIELPQAPVVAARRATKKD